MALELLGAVRSAFVYSMLHFFILVRSNVKELNAP
jgi:hypothetical protein